MTCAPQFLLGDHGGGGEDRIAGPREGADLLGKVTLYEETELLWRCLEMCSDMPSPGYDKSFKNFVD